MQSKEYSPKEFELENMLSHLLKQADELLMKSLELPTTSIHDICLRADGQYNLFKFKFMCVVDSLLMFLYNCYLRSDQVRSLFGSHEVLRAAMVFVGAQMYNEAKACWLFAQIVLYKNSKLNITKANSTDTLKINAWSEPTDHLNIFNELVLGKYHFDAERYSPSIAQDVLHNTLSKFEHLGGVRVLGLKDPTVILVDINRRMDTAPPLTVSDHYGRVYELQGLLMTGNSFLDHVISGLHGSDGWVFYDDLKTEYGDFNYKSADFKKDCISLLAGYVNITQDEPYDVPFGIAEEGGYGTTVFNPPSYNQPKEHQD